MGGVGKCSSLLRVIVRPESKPIQKVNKPTCHRPLTRHRSAIIDCPSEYPDRAARRERAFRHPADLVGRSSDSMAGFRGDRAIDGDQGGAADLVSDVAGRTESFRDQ